MTGGVLNSGKIKIEGTSGKSYNLDDFTTVTSCPFPVGFGGFFQTDPNEIYSGTKWEQKKDVFILASGDTYAAGSTGGEAQHTLTVEEMPNHVHSYAADWTGGGGQGATSGEPWALVMSNAGDGIGTWAFGLDIKDHFGYTGGSQPHNNMPPYFSVPFWIRTA